MWLACAKAALATACRAHRREATQQEAFKFRTRAVVYTVSTVSGYQLDDSKAS